MNVRIISSLIFVFLLSACGSVSQDVDDVNKIFPWKLAKNDSYRIEVNPDPKWGWEKCPLERWSHRVCLKRDGIILKILSTTFLHENPIVIAKQGGYNIRSRRYTTWLQSGEKIILTSHILNKKGAIDLFFLTFCKEIPGFGPRNKMCGLAWNKSKLNGGLKEFENSAVWGIFKKMSLVQQHKVIKWTVFSKSSNDSKKQPHRGGDYYKEKKCRRAAANVRDGYRRNKNFEASAWCVDTSIPLPVSK